MWKMLCWRSMATYPHLLSEGNPSKTFASFVMWSSVRFYDMLQQGGCLSIQPSPVLCKPWMLSGLISSASEKSVPDRSDLCWSSVKPQLRKILMMWKFISCSPITSSPYLRKRSRSWKVIQPRVLRYIPLCRPSSKNSLREEMTNFMAT